MKSRWVVLLAGIAVAVLVLVLAPVSQRTAHAGVLDDLFDAWVNQDGEIQKQSEWKRFPNWQPQKGQLAKTDNWGRTTGVWGCIHWPQLHLSDFHHSGGYDVTCGYLSRFPTYDPSKEVPGVEPPPGQRWLCIPGTNVLIYSEPYNKGICGFFSKDFRPNGAFEPTRAQTDATDTAFDALLEFYSGNDAQENLKKAMKLYNDRSYLSTDQDLSQEKMPEPERQKIMALLDKGERQAACRAYAEAVTKAEGLDSVTKATLRTTQEYLVLRQR